MLHLFTLAAVAFTETHRVASPLGNGGLEVMSLYHNPSCQGEAVDLTGLDKQGLLGGVGTCFAIDTGAVKVEYFEGSCGTYDEPILTATLYGDTKCSSKVTKVTLLKENCATIGGKSIKYSIPLNNADYCKYVEAMTAFHASETVSRAWANGACEGTPVRELKQKADVEAMRSKTDSSSNCALVRGDGGQVPDAYVQTQVTCTRFKKVLMASRVYTDKECKNYAVGHPGNVLSKVLPFVLGACNDITKANPTGAGMSLMTSFSNPHLEAQLCEVGEMITRYNIPQSSFVDERTFNASLVH